GDDAMTLANFDVKPSRRIRPVRPPAATGPSQSGSLRYVLSAAHDAVGSTTTSESARTTGSDFREAASAIAGSSWPGPGGHDAAWMSRVPCPDPSTATATIGSR